MRKFLTILIPFILASLLAVGGSEFLCRKLDSILVADGQKTTEQKGQMQGVVPLYKSSLPAKNVATKKRKENYTIITKRSLFGKTSQKKMVKKEEVAPVLRETSLDLILLGTISGSSNVQRAIIKDKKKRTQDIYYKGDSIGSAIIKEVKRAEVILTVNGKDEILKMEELKIPLAGQ